MSKRRGSAATGSSQTEAATTAEAAAFPGQGVDASDLARVLAEHDDHPLVRRLARLVGTADWAGIDITDTLVAQPAVYTAGLVLAEEELGGDLPALVFGHSLGELTAVAVAGGYSAERGQDLVARRAELCHEVHRQRPGRMIVVMRLDGPRVEWVRRVAAAESHGVLDVAVVNGPGQWVLSGDVDAAARAIDLVNELDGVARPLPIGGGYHSSVLLPVVDVFGRELSSALDSDLRVPFVSCTSQTTTVDRTAVATLLARSLALPVDWVATLRAVAANGATAALDVGPSQTLTNLAKFVDIVSFRSLRPARNRPSASSGSARSPSTSA